MPAYTTTQESLELSDDYERDAQFRVRKKQRLNGSFESLAGLPVIDLTIDEPDASPPSSDASRSQACSVQRAIWHSSSLQTSETSTSLSVFNYTESQTLQEWPHTPLSFTSRATHTALTLHADREPSNASTSSSFHTLCHVDIEKARDGDVAEARHVTGIDTDSANAADLSAGSQICYGMLCDIETSCKVAGDQFSRESKLQWNGSAFLQDATTGNDVVQLSPRILQILSKLVEFARLDIQFLLERCCSLPSVQVKNQSRIVRTTSGALYNLSAILYGSLEVADAIGEWLSQIKLYLQLPRDCDRNVRYINPQCLKSSEEPLMTFGITSLGDDQENDSAPSSQVTFEDLYTETVYDESEQPPNVTFPLRKHQRQALTFMLRREEGWAYEDEDRPDLWRRETDSCGVVRYRNRISGHSQMGPPKPFQGGILADEMGLGKTCTMLSLISANRSPDISVGDATPIPPDAVKATLVVVPFSLIEVWNKQVERHFTPASLRTYVYHSQAKQSQALSFDKYDIVITTYNTVAHKWKRHRHDGQKHGKNHLFNVKWHRIVLDEAHVIRTRQTMNARAVCALRSDRRWCITGTPIQNRLSDLYSLFHFLRVEPYENWKTFEEEIMRPLKYGNNNALQRIQALMKTISIRRPKRVVSLPSSVTSTKDVMLSTHELAQYEGARRSVIEIIDTAMRQTKAGGSAYLSAFQRINDLRYICNHGVRPNRTQNKCALRGKNEQASFADQLDELLLGSGEVCVQCGTDLREEREIHIGNLGLPVPNSQDLGSLQLCSACLNGTEASSPASSSPSSQSEFTDIDLGQPSSKIQALLHHLQTVPSGEKSAVFSYWTSTLDAVGTALSNAGVKYAYFHGSLSTNKRQQTLQSFAIDPSIQVILVSITCGGQGLDLTAANHAFLLEPQWNPMLEEQAMSRVHRIGQTKPVRLVRFIVRDTWEEKIRLLQESKKSLAGLVVDRRTLKEGDDGRKQLYFLRELVA